MISSNDVDSILHVFLGLTVDLPSHHQNENWAFLVTKRRFLAGVIASYLGFRDYQNYRGIIMSGVHVTPGFRDKYEKYVDWENIQNYIANDYKPPFYPKTNEEYLSTLKQLEISDPDKIRHVISKFESGLADPLNFPLMAEDLSNLPPAYVQASEYDTMRDDALLYAERLKESGNRVILDYQKQGWHGNIQFAQTLLTTTSPVNVYNNITRFIRNTMSLNTNT